MSDREALERNQLERLNHLWAAHPPFGSNLTFPLDHYTRYCQTSGTSGEPMPWVDTTESWQSMLDCWKRVHQAAGITSTDERVFFAFSFGPFLGFWTAYEAATQLGFLAIPGGGMRSEARLQMMQRFEVTAFCGTPTYAMRLGGLAKEMGLTFPKLKAILVAGEPGGSLPEVRARLEQLWGAHVRVCDHHGLTETGPVTHQDPDHPGRLLVMEDAFIGEILDPKTGQEVGEGETGELVLTTLNRTACPLFRYHTGDLVRKRFTPQLALEGGILGRIDDMVLVRGVNVYPSAIERVVRRFEAIQEYRVIQTTRDAMIELKLEIESKEGEENIAKSLQNAMWDQFQLRIPVETVRPGILPEQEFKAKRWVNESG
ncbi:MAG: phenylacetate--CoA ligase family protein [Verrucomicrobiales bacterium]